MRFFNSIFFFFFLFSVCEGSIRVGVYTRNLTPPFGTPSAGYIEREGREMIGIHDPLLATALVIESEGKLVAFCSVDHLGFLYEMTQDVIRQVKILFSPLQNFEIYVGASHTHSGGGAYFDIPIVGELVAGPYDADIREFYIRQAAIAILEAYFRLQPAKIGIGYGKTKDLIAYNGVWPKEMTPSSDVFLIKVTKPDDTPLALFYSTSIYPDVLDASNMLFSSDVIGYARKYLSLLIGENVTTLFFNGPTADIVTQIPDASNLFKSCELIGKKLAFTLSEIWEQTATQDTFEMTAFKEVYTFEPKPTLSGFLLPIESRPTEINLLVLEGSHAFLMIPAEISCTYDPLIKGKGLELGFKRVSLSNLVNDAHGYIYSPEAWRLNPPESDFSFGGEKYGQIVEEKIVNLMKKARLW